MTAPTARVELEDGDAVLLYEGTNGAFSIMSAVDRSGRDTIGVKATPDQLLRLAIALSCEAVRLDPTVGRRWMKRLEGVTSHG